MHSLGTLDENGAGHYAVSAAGTLAFVRGGVNPEEPRGLAWLARDGQLQELPMDAHQYMTCRLSPDGRRALTFTMTSLDPAPWVYQFERRNLARVAAGVGTSWPAWFPDGRQIVFVGLLGRPGTGDLMRLSTDASSASDAERLVEFGSPAPGARGRWPACWGDDGRELVYLESEHPGAGSRRIFHIWAVPIARPGQPYALVRTKGSDQVPAVSPDGRWLAYVSNVSGGEQVYCAPTPEGRWRPCPAASATLRRGAATAASSSSSRPRDARL